MDVLSHPSFVTIFGPCVRFYIVDNQSIVLLCGLFFRLSVDKLIAIYYFLSKPPYIFLPVVLLFIVLRLIVWKQHGVTNRCGL